MLAGTQICERGYFEKHCEFRKNSGRHGTKFQSSETFAGEKGTRRWLNYSSDSSALFLVSQRWARRANECASRRPLGRAFEASLADAQLEPAESVGMRAVHFRSRIPAMALT